MNILDQYRREIHALCLKYSVKELYVFGSLVTGSEFSAESDIDLAARFDKSEPAGSFDRYMELKAELEALLHRNVDLVGLSNLRNRYFRQELDRTKELVYAA